MVNFEWVEYLYHYPPNFHYLVTYTVKFGEENDKDVSWVRPCYYYAYLDNIYEIKLDMDSFNRSNVNVLLTCNLHYH